MIWFRCHSVNRHPVLTIHIKTGLVKCNNNAIHPLKHCIITTFKVPCTLFCEYLAIPTCAWYTHGIDRLPVNARTFWYRFYASPVSPSASKYLTYGKPTTGIEGQVPPGATKWWVRQILFRCFQRYPDHVLATSAKGGRLNCNFHTRIKRESFRSGLPWQRRNATCSWHVAHTVV